MLKSFADTAIFICVVKLVFASGIQNYRCRENEVLSNCANRVSEYRKCSELGKPIEIVAIDRCHCVKGCICKATYLRADNGTCIPENQCPSPCGCGINEEYDTCIASCPPRRCDVDESTIRCAAPLKPGDPKCKAGCRCADNFYRNDDEVCVPRNKCPPKCGKNEVPTSCFESVCERRNCTDLGKPTVCVRLDPHFCSNGCLCKEGYLRDKNGICVPIDQCPKPCGNNEIRTSCFEANCELRNCTDLGKPITCVRMDPRFCTDGCLCKEGYLRDKNGTCVPIDQCPTPKCGENEVPTSCIEAICEYRNCTDLGKPTICVRLDPSFCTNGCLCKEGYLRDKNGICVPIHQCPKPCGNNEISTSCFEANCELRNCTDLGKTITCVRLDPRFCTDGCLCKEGYLRDENGICIPIDKCPTKPPTVICGPNEVSTDCVNGGCGIWYCAQTQEICNLLLDEDCRPGCLCRDGWLRAENGTCIPADQCPPKCNGPNEYFSCGGACDNVCATLRTKNQTNCPIVNKKCNPKCYCQEGYARDDNNICIPIHKCPPPICEINEVFDDCPATCPPRTCDALGKAFKCRAPPKPGDPECNPSCRCADGHYRNKQGVCVPKNKCPKPIVCGANEVYDSCVNGGCGRWNCSQPVEICIDLNAGACREGCRCKKGLLRADNGTCIPADQCPLNCFGENEVVGCKSTCPPQTCESIGKTYHCPLQPAVCIPECRCKKDFYRNKIGECISKLNCLKCTGCHEYFSCGGACDNVCATLARQNQTSCSTVNVKCNPMCYCEEGYARDHNNTCIPISKCPKLVCGKNEVKDDCPATCPPRTCDALGRAYKCPAPPKPGDPECNPSCRCADGYYRNKQGVCVPKNKCPKPIVCGANEEYDSCVNGGCGRWNCSQPVEICIDLIAGACREGCRCKKGLLRADNGTCIPADQCPLNCIGENEVVGCKSTCPPQTCESIGKTYHCPLQPAVCIPECRCKKDFYRNKIGECISKVNCLKCTGCHEYFSCGGACDNVCATLARQNQTSCPRVNVKCNPMCYCEEGYARDHNNTCVPISKCPKPPKCRTNEVYDTCPPICPSQSCDFDPRVSLCAPNPQPGDSNCKPGCRCIDNYLRNKLNQCVPKDQCDNNDTSNALKKFEQGNIAFTLKFLYEGAKNNPGVSLIFSPFSVLFLLAQLALCAVGTTLEQLLSVLNLDTTLQIRNFIPKYLDTLSSQQNITFDMTEKVYGNIQYKFSPDFERDISDIFKAEPQNLDFCEPIEAASNINAWVEQQTNNLIKNLVSPNSLSCNTVLVLVNAIYFKGDWKNKFDPENTRKQDFYVNNKKTVQVNMMRRTGSYKYAKINNPEAQIVELPYRSDNFSLMILLPATKDGINNMIDQLIDLNYSFSNISSNMKETRLDLSVPAFNISTTTDLKPSLEKFNVTAPFDPETAHFANILQNPTKIYVSSATQKATIIVNESGAEAAAANGWYQIPCFTLGFLLTIIFLL